MAFLLAAAPETHHQRRNGQDARSEEGDGEWPAEQEIDLSGQRLDTGGVRERRGAGRIERGDGAQQRRESKQAHRPPPPPAQQPAVGKDQWQQDQ